LPANNGKPDNLVQIVSEVSDRISNLIREEVELAKVEVGRKATSLLKGAAAIAAGAVFGVFAIVIGLEALAWGLDAILVQGAGDIWEGFLIVFGVLAILAVLAFAIATRMLKRGAPPTPTMAIDEAKRIRETVAAKSEAEAIAAPREIQG
jgi:Putative Actinobacterial Holin-X, holin superfamily III